MERPAWDKHSSLLQTLVNYDRKKFYNVGLRLNHNHENQEQKYGQAKKILGSGKKILSKQKNFVADVIYTLNGFDAAALLGYRIFNFLSLIQVSVLVNGKEATIN